LYSGSRCAFYIPETDYYHGNLADSRDLYSHVPPISDRQLHRRQESGIGATQSRRADRAGSLRQRGGQLRGQEQALRELAQVQGGEKEEEGVRCHLAIPFHFIRTHDASSRQSPLAHENGNMRVSYFLRSTLKISQLALKSVRAGLAIVCVSRKHIEIYATRPVESE
jgi:hypothetical protein